LFFPPLDLVGSQDLDLCCLVAGPLENRHARQDWSSFQDPARDGADGVFVVQVQRCRMDGARAGVLAEADRGHLQNAAADAAGKARVRFHAVNYHNAVRGQRLGTDVNLHAVTGLAKCSTSIDAHKGI
jgi:hypothetical protein